MTQITGTEYYDELKTWAEPMAHVTNSIYFEYLTKALETLYSYKKYGNVYPNRENIFKSFRDCPYDSLKVVVLGRDPYCDGSDTGVAFANIDKLEISPELDKIYTAIYGSQYMINPNFDSSLENISKQGCLFLNPILTVEENKPLSHFGTWNRFTIALLKMLSKNKKGIIYILLGNIALSFKPFISSNTNIILEYDHPSESVKLNNPWNCTHFKTLNYILDRYNSKIIW